MRSYEERAKSFIQKIFVFLPEETACPFTVRRAVNSFNKLYNRNVIVGHGISRIALITSDYVVKFDFDPDEVDYVGGCECEEKLYAQAEKDGFAYLFAKTTRYEYNNRVFYIMPRIRGIDDERGWDAYHYMSYEEVDWCEEHNLSDLHCGNYGFRNGHICIIDYACNRSI